MKEGATMIKAGFSVLFAAVGVFAFSDLNDTGSLEKVVARMQGRMDSIETELHKLKIEKSDNSPGATGEIRNWGKGLYGQIHLDVNISNFEIGYLFPRKHCRIGLATGLLLNDAFDDLLHLTGYRKISLQDVWRPGSWYGCFLLGTPVFLNFVSLTGNVKTSMLIMNCPQSTNGKMKFGALGYGFGLGGDVEFWLTKHCSFLFGPEIDLVVNSETGWGRFYSTGSRFGLKYFL
jgi:hypothetical protein